MSHSQSRAESGTFGAGRLTQLERTGTKWHYLIGNTTVDQLGMRKRMLNGWQFELIQDKPASRCCSIVRMFRRSMRIARQQKQCRLQSDQLSASPHFCNLGCGGSRPRMSVAPTTGVSMTTFIKLTVAILLTLLVAGALGAQQPAKKDEPKWFVMRNAQTGQCWTVLLTRIQGVYRHGSGRVAAGPFETEAQAKQRLEDLHAPGTCTN